MSRYLERDFLCSYDLSEEFFQNLNLEILDVQPLRKVFIIKTKVGDKILKKVDYDQNKIKFIYTSLEYIKKSFGNVMEIEKVKDDNCYVKWNNDFYILMKKNCGIEAIETNPLDMEICSKAIGKLHMASKGIERYLEAEGSMIIRGENLITYYGGIKDELNEIKNFISKYKYKNEFDKLFLENVDECIQEIEGCLDKLKNTNYEKMLKDEKFLALCHNDLAHHNFLIEKEEGTIIDFDYSSINLKALDVADLILKWIKNSTFDKEKAEKLIECYEEIVKLTEEEKELIKIFLEFPRDVSSIFRIYYRKEKKWEYGSYLNKLKGKLENDKYRRMFLKEF